MLRHLPLVPAVLAVLALPAAAAQWTIGIYLCADNGLNDQAYVDLAEMMEIGSTSEVNVVVQVDNAARDSHPECRRYLVHKDRLEPLGELGEVDMADTATLREFASYLARNHRADRYFLILWDHGNGWTDEYREARTLFIDESHNSTMSVAGGELRAALERIRDVLGGRLEILGFDACLMGMVEVAVEALGCCDYLLASEGLVPWGGWPYDEVLEPIVARPTSTARELLPQICGAYIDEYPGEDVCLSALELAQLGRALPVLRATLADSVNPGDPELLSARDRVQTFNALSGQQPCRADDNVDFIHLWELGPAAGTGALRAAFVPMVAANRAAGALASARGMAGWFPDNYLAFKTRGGDYRGLAFADSVPWPQFLNCLFGADDVKPEQPAISSHRLGGRGDITLYWSRCFDLAPVSYDLFEAESVREQFSDNCEDLGHWSAVGWTATDQRARSGSRSFFSGSAPNLDNRLELVNGIALPEGGLLSLYAWFDTEESLDSAGNIERDACYIEWSHGAPGWHWFPLDSVYGSQPSWQERRYPLPASQSLRLRFRYVTDAGQSLAGVFLDDIAVYRFSGHRAVVCATPDTSFYLFNRPHGNPHFFLTARDSFGNVSMASQFYAALDVESYAEPYTRPAPFDGPCRLWLDYPAGERARVRVYTLSGTLVREWTDVAERFVEWDGRNAAGRELASGVYLVTVTAEGFRKVGKIARVGP